MLCKVISDIPGRLRMVLSIPIRPIPDPAWVESRLSSLPGVRALTFNRRTRSLLVRYEGGARVRRALLDSVASAPFPEVLKPKPPSEFDRKKRRVLTSGALLVLGPLFPGMVRPMLTLRGGLPFLRRGASSLLRGRVDSAVLDALAIGSSLASGEFFTASLISFLLKLGEFLEEWTRRRFRRQLSAMFRTGEEWAWVVREGIETRVPLARVREGDVLVVRMGSLIPVDGVIVEGEAMVNQAGLTGESLAVMKRKGKSVYAGTVVEEGVLRVLARKVGGETRAARVVKLIEEAEVFKAETQTRGERMADAAVPFSLALSGLVWLLTGNAGRAASVLLVDYSCAIKLATPLAILAGLARAARESVLIKGGRALETLAAADTFVLDKTGTLTEAAPRVVEVVAFGGLDEDYVLRWTACVEEHFPHPVASAVVRDAAERRLHHGEEHEEVEYVLAHGIVSRVHGRRIMVGSRHLVHEDEGVDVREADLHLARFAEKGYSVLYVAVGGRLAGLIALHDPLRADARDFVRRLGEDGVSRVVMLTGDGEATARTAAAEAGIAVFHAGAFPETKVEVIRELRRNGRVVAMVGDGINDSPALSHADVGISMKHGADIAREACDVLLMEGELEHILDARRIARETLRLVSRNTGAIFAVNTGAILLALGGVISPVVSAAIHNFSTIGISLAALAPMRLPGKRREAR